MNLCAKASENDIVELVMDSFDNNESEFILKGSSQHLGNIALRINYPLKVDNRYNKDDYEVFLFFNDTFAENDIYQVYEHEHDIRIGWIFPLQALMSDKHSYADNNHFLPYAYVAFENLLNKRSTGFTNVPLINDTGNYSLGDFYKEDETIVLVLCNSRIQGINGFDIDNYLPFLYSKGYYCSIGNYRSPVLKSQERLNIKGISKNIRNEGFITQLFKELLIDEKHHLIKFYLLYQVIELLIERVFNKELTDMLHHLSSQTKSLFQVKEDLSDIAKEKERIKKLFSTYTRIGSSQTILMSLCNTLLQSISRDIKSNAAEALYSVRNLFVHEYRSIPSSSYSLIYDINNAFEDVIIEILYEINC